MRKHTPFAPRRDASDVKTASHGVASYYTDGLTLAAIGRHLGVSEARVSQLHTRAIAQLRSVLGVVMVSKLDNARAAA